MIILLCLEGSLLRDLSNQPHKSAKTFNRNCPLCFMVHFRSSQICNLSVNFFFNIYSNKYNKENYFSLIKGTKIQNMTYQLQSCYYKCNKKSCFTAFLSVLLCIKQELAFRVLTVLNVKLLQMFQQGYLLSR